MAKINITLTDEHIKLMKSLKFQKMNDDIAGIDNYDMYGGSYKFEQMAYILGYNDKMLEESVESIFGPKYEPETQKHLVELDAFMVEHLIDLEEILHQFCDKGLKPGKYVTRDYEHLWHYEENNKK